MKRSLKSKFVLSMCIITIIVMVITSLVTLVMSIKIFRNSTETSMEQLAMMGYLEVDSWFEEKEQMLRLIGNELHAYEPQEQVRIETYLARYMQGEYPYITDIYVVTPANDMYSAIGSVPPGVDWHTRYWYYGPRESGGLVYTSPYISTDPGNPMIITISIPVTGRNGSDMGVLVMDIELDSLVQFINEERIMDTSGRAFLLDESSEFIAHENSAFLPKIVGDFEEQYTRFDSVGIKRGKEVISNKILLSRGQDWDGVKKYIATVEIDRNGWVYGFSIPVKDFYGDYMHLIWIWLLVVAVMIAISVLLATVMARRLLIPVESIIHTASHLAEGDMQVEINVQTGDELEALSNQFRKMIASNSQQIAALQRMSEGDFTVHIDPKSDRDVLSNTLNDVIQRLRELMTSVNDSISMFAAATVEIADASAHVSEGSQNQTAAVAILSEALNRIRDNTTENAENASNAAKTIHKVHQEADLGNTTMVELVGAVTKIDKTTNNITQIIKFIEDIAFQTNILALNASVEAARAGQHGKGFAVVADEVRTLASHSAQAASQITTLIQDCFQATQHGVDTAKHTQQIFEEIARRIKETAEIVERIDSIFVLQVEEINSVSDSVSQINTVVQQNNVTAEETASTSQQMSAQAQQMEESMRRFQFGRSQKQSGRSAPVAASTSQMRLDPPPAVNLQSDSKY